MATIVARKRKTGTRYTAQIRIMRHGTMVYSESETFDKRAAAKAWADMREAELAMPGVLERQRHAGVTVGQVLEWYRDDYDGLTKFGRSKLSHVNYLINRADFAGLDAIRLSTPELVAHAQARIKFDGVKPCTVNNDFIWLSNAFRAARIGRGVPLEQQVIEDAMYLCRKEGLIAKAEERERRPELRELELLLEYFEGQRKATIPVARVVLFAIFSARRQEEICRIRWDDLDEEKQRVMVRDIKHPRKKINAWCYVPDRAWAILKAQPREAGQEFIFPYNSRSVKAAFIRACKILGIKDLRFHDLRHEGASHYFELGWGIPQVAQVTGHRDWKMLQRYTHLQEHGIVDKYKGWPLLDAFIRK